MNIKTLEMINIAFDAMYKEVNKQNLSGTAAIAFLEDSSTVDWQMSIRVFGKAEVAANDRDIGWNLIGMACSKVAESISTKTQSGSATRPLKNGEVGFMGADIQACGKGYVAAAFSGASDQQDLDIARIGIASVLENLPE